MSVLVGGLHGSVSGSRLLWYKVDSKQYLHNQHCPEAAQLDISYPSDFQKGERMLPSAAPESPPWLMHKHDTFNILPILAESCACKTSDLV